MAGFTPKQVLINNKAVLIVQNSLKTKAGRGDNKIRTQVFGKQVVQVTAKDLETSKSQVMFDLITTDSEGNTDPRQLIKIWQDNGNANMITIVPDGLGKNQLYPNMALVSDPEINESPDGVISLTWEGGTVQLT